MTHIWVRPELAEDMKQRCATPITNFDDSVLRIFYLGDASTPKALWGRGKMLWHQQQRKQLLGERFKAFVLFLETLFQSQGLTHAGTGSAVEPLPQTVF